MIAKLKGLVDSLGDDHAVIDVNGVGYLVFCSARTLSKLEVGLACQLAIETHVREDHIHLYGFFDKAEKDWFGLLTTVQGVGAKVALAILSVAPPEQLLQGIAAQDKTVFTRASGVGPKVATRILTELKDKAGKLAFGAFQAAGKEAGAKAPIASIAAGPMEDAISALVNLGYKRVEAFEAVGIVSRELGEDAEAGAMIRAALKHLAKDLIR